MCLNKRTESYKQQGAIGKTCKSLHSTCNRFGGTQLQLACSYYNNMRRKQPKPHIIDATDGSHFPGFPVYPASEDIFNKAIEMQEIDPENISEAKQATEESGTTNEKGVDEDPLGDDLDVPGAELDDAMEAIGSEDEENNFYSLSEYDPIDLANETGDEKQIEN